MNKIVKPYELLVRFKNGEYSGGHIQDIEQVINDDGTLYSEKVLEPRLISKDSEEYSSVIGDINPSLIDSNAMLQSDNAMLQSDNARLVADKVRIQLKLDQELLKAKAK